MLVNLKYRLLKKSLTKSPNEMVKYQEEITYNTVSIITTQIFIEIN